MQSPTKTEQDSSNREQTTAFFKRQGIFGMGLSMNPHLEVITMLFLVFAGIFIKLFFEASPTINGLNGPATTTVWGYSLTAFALFILLFTSMYLQKNEDKTRRLGFLENDSESFINKVKTITISFLGLHSIPILLTLLFVISIIALNFTYYKKINSNSVSDSYNQYSNYSTFLLLIQVILLSKYMLDLVNSTSDTSIQLKNKGKISGFSIILSTINFIFALIMYVLLNFYTTDDGNYEEFS